MAEKRSFDIVEKPLFITASLIDSVAFHVNMNPHNEWKTKSLIQLKASLKRNNVFTHNEFTKRGQEFEDKIVAFSRASKEKFLEVFEKDVMCDISKLEVFYDALQGDVVTQKTMKGAFEVEGQPFTFYGVADVVQGNPPVRHIDIKTTSSWKTGVFSSEKAYKDRAQHLMYMYLDKVQNFDYMIAEFLNEGTKDNPVWKVIDVHEVPIVEPDYKALEKKLHKRILETVNFISQDEEMWTDYCNVFTRSC